MPEIIRLQAPEGHDSGALPPAYFLSFTQDEFPSFLSDPVGTLNNLGQTVKNLTVTVKDHV